MAFDVGDFWLSHLGQLMACNADDGPPHVLPGPGVAKDAFAKAAMRYNSLPAARKTPEVFEKVLTEACWGPDAPRPPSRPADPSFTPVSKTACDGLDGGLSTVITADRFCELLSLEDREDFALDYGVDIPGNYRGDPDPKWMEELGRLPSADRRFRMKPEEGHGRPLVWFTRREEMARLLGVGTGLADLVRDHLGLIHHGPTVPYTGFPNHLFVLHIPSAVALKAGHWRPSVLDGVDNRRFMVHGGPLRAPWGRTVDLATFASGGAGGGAERVLLRLQKELMMGSEELEFDYIGRVTTDRGLTAADDNDAFIRSVLRGRNLAALIAAIYP